MRHSELSRGRAKALPLGVAVSVFVALALGAAAGDAATPTRYQCNYFPAAATRACKKYHDPVAVQRIAATAAKQSVTVARAAFTGNYNTIWTFIAPQLQSDVSHSRWLTCQKRNPVAPRGLHVDRIAVANIVEVPMVLTHFGHLFVVQVQLQVIFTRAGQQNAALVNSYWLQNSKGAWVLVWPPAVYSSYHAGACDPAGPSRALY